MYNRQMVGNIKITRIKKKKINRKKAYQRRKSRRVNRDIIKISKQQSGETA